MLTAVSLEITLLPLKMMSKRVRTNFWKKLSLDEMSQTEWESLCDRCGKCCLIKLYDEETSKVKYTQIACHLFDNKSCKCMDYENRKKIVNKCLIKTKDTLKTSHQWMPKTCAYRLVYEGKELESWHHLISGSFNTVHNAGESVQHSTISETEVREEDWQHYVIIS